MIIKNFDANVLNRYRFIVSSGCSYGRITEYTFRAFNGSNSLYNQYGKNWLDTKENLIVLNSSLGSQGSDWQADSSIHICNSLLNMGVLPENIYVIIEWSQWSRFSVHPFNYVNLDLNKFNFNNGDGFYVDVINKENQIKDDFEKNFINEFWKTFGISKSNILSIPKINDRIYITPTHLPADVFKELGYDYGYFIDEARKVDISTPIENKLKTYLNNLLRTQFFLENKGLKYNFFFMQSTLSEWYKDEKGMLKDSFMRDLKLTQQYDNNLKEIVINPKYKPINNKNSDLEIVAPELSNEINMLNFDNIWFYENEKYRRGGIDEWTIDNFKEVGYINFISGNVDDIKPHDIISDYGAHPNSVPYTLLWNKVATNCDFVKLNKDCEEFILNKFWEDYESENYTKNGITLSKRYWDKISKNNYL
jgi:hypothetical protein